MCSTSPSITTTTTNNSTSIDLEVWFVCHPCKLWFKNVTEIIEHKKEVHFEELQETKIIVFEEAKLGRTDIANGPYPPNQTDAPQETALNYLREVVKVEIRAPPHNCHPDQEGATLDVDLTESEFPTDDCNSHTHETITLDNVKLIVSDDNAAPHFIKIDLNDIVGLHSDTDANIPPNSDSNDDATEATQTEVHFNYELNSPSSHCSEIEALPNPQVLLRRLTLAQIKTASSSNNQNDTIRKSTMGKSMFKNGKMKLVGPFKCHICDRSFKIRHTLLRHLQSHSDQRPFECHLCDMSFKYKYVLTRHVQRHSDARPFKCLKPSCGKYFKCKDSYKQHASTHVKKKRFECAEQNCGKAFKSKIHLKRHIRSHSELRKYKCNYPNCNRLYKRLDHFKIHLKRRHTIWKRPRKVPQQNQENENYEEILSL